MRHIPKLVNSLVIPGNASAPQEAKDDYYITKKFKVLDCVKYVPKSEDPAQTCQCGRPLEKHQNPKLAISEETEWTREKCTKESVTNAYGNINFTRVEADLLPKYLRFKHGTPVEELSVLLREKWLLPKPYLIMVIIGGLGGLVREEDDRIKTTESGRAHLQLMERMRYVNRVQDGLVDAAVSTQAWIFTSGLDNGVSKLLGEACRTKRTFKQTIPTIGVAPWGCIRESYQLVSQDNKGLFPANYTVDRKSRMKGLKGLDQNHTSFLFPDFGTYRNYHVNEMSEFKINLEKQLKRDMDSNLITILIEGGLTSLIEAARRIKNRIAIVVMRGTGRAADLLGDVNDLYREYECDIHNQEFREKVENEFNKHFLATADSYNQREEALIAVYDIIDNKCLVTIWDKDESTSGEVDKAVLMGLINSLSHAEMKYSEDLKMSSITTSSSSDSDSSFSPSSDDGSSISERKTTFVRKKEKMRYKREFLQIELAIKWHRLDIAEEFLFKDKTFTVNQLNSLLAIAMEHKEIDFIMSIMSKGADLKRFLTEDQFESFLNNPRNLDDTLLNRLLRANLSKKVKHNDTEMPIIYEHFQRVIYEISQGVYKCPRKRVPSRRLADGLVSKKGDMTRDFMSCNTGYRSIKKQLLEDFSKGNKTQRPDELSCFEDPENLIVLYFVLIYEHEIAIVLWKYSRTPLILSLICAHINQWLANQERSRKEVTGEHKHQFQRFEREWEDLALQIIDETNRNYNEQWVHALIKHRYSAWGGKTVLEIADFKRSVRFIAHPAVQDYVTKMWMGAMSLDTSYMSVVLGIFLGPWWIEFRSYKSSTRQRLEQQREKQRTEFINQNKSTKERTGDVEMAGKNCSKRRKRRSFREVLQKLLMFHHAPVTKYFVNLGLYIIFLFIFFCALVIDPNKAQFLKDIKNFNYFEWTVIVWMISTVPLEIRQVYHGMPSTVIAKLQHYIVNGYNKTDVAAVMTLAMAVFMKQTDFFSPDDVRDQMLKMLIFKTVFGVTFVLMTIRLLQFLQISSIIGPKITMITKMLYDLLFFVSIIFVFIVAYGVFTEAIIYPRGKDVDITELISCLWKPYIHLYGELALDDIEDELSTGYCLLNISLGYGALQTSIPDSEIEKCKDKDKRTFECANDNICKAAKNIVRVALIVYLCLGAVLMLNLLIAVFTHTYECVSTITGELWKWQRYDLMTEFKERSAIPFPFNIVSYIFRFLRWIWRQFLCGGQSYLQHREYLKHHDEYNKSNILLLEKECLRSITERKFIQSDDTGGGGGSMDLKVKESLLRILLNEGSGLRSSLLSETRISGRNTLVSHVPNPDKILGVEVEDIGMDEVQVDAAEMQVTFVSPTTPPVTRKSSLNKQLTGHILTNIEGEVYPETRVTRYSVVAEQRSWDVSLPTYSPAVVNQKKGPILLEKEHLFSYEGSFRTDSVNGYPFNPLGRTGIIGRGLLKDYGPNFYSMPIITRFTNSEEAPSLDTPLDVLVLNTDEAKLPTYHDLPDRPLHDDLVSVLSSSIDPKYHKELNKIINRGILIKRGIVDSKYNTDNAWCEMFIISYHDDDDHTFKRLTFTDRSPFKWIAASNKMFKDEVHAKYFDRAVYSRRASRYMGTSSHA